MWGNCVINGIPTIQCIFPLVGIIINTALALVGTIAVFLILFAAIKFITEGSGKGAEEAKKILTYAIIGLLVVLLSFFIVNLIAGFTGVDCIKNFRFDSCR